MSRRLCEASMRRWRADGWLVRPHPYLGAFLPPRPARGSRAGARAALLVAATMAGSGSFGLTGGARG